MEHGHENGPLSSLSEKQLFALSAGAVTGLGLFARLLLALRRWRKHRPPEKHLSRLGGTKITFKMRTPRRKFLDRS